MAAIVFDQVTVGNFPLPRLPIREFKVPGAPFELAPFPTFGLAALASDLSPGANYISTYQPFNLSFTAIPTIATESVPVVNIIGPTRCLCEDPFEPVTDQLSEGEVWEPPVSKYWTIPSFTNRGGGSIEPRISVSGFAGGGIISGYFTERNYTDRALYVRYLDAVTKFSSDGFFYVPIEQFEIDFPFFDPIKFDEVAVPLPSSVNVDTFFPETIVDANQFESPKLIPYLVGGFGDIIKYDATKFKKLRFFFTITLTSNFGVFPYEFHMTVQNNRKYAENRLKFSQKYTGIQRSIL
jgi:hypothetical protein